MGTIWVKEFTGGLDTRRMPETASGGVLIKANNGHVTRGGEFEQRAAFVPAYSLPAGTVGMFYTRAGLVVFGSVAAPVLPTGVSYQRLQHSDPSKTLVRVLSADLYKGKIYAVGEFSDGTVNHYYDGVIVSDWYDGRARADVTIKNGGVRPAKGAVGEIEITAGTLGGGNEVTNIVINGVSLISAPVAHTGSNTTTATAVAAAITSHTSTPDYTAVASGDTVTINAVTTGPAINGKAIVVTVGGTVTVISPTGMREGVDALYAQMDDIRINGVSVISAPVLWSTTSEAMASDIAAAITSYSSTPEYTAAAAGATINIAASDAGPGSNGFAVQFYNSNGLSIDPEATVLAGGGTFGGDYATGEFTVTQGAGVDTYAPSINGVALTGAPVAWTTSLDATAAAIAAAINSHTSAPDYTATADGAKVTVKTATRTAAVNGVAIVVALTGTASITSAGTKASFSFRVVQAPAGTTLTASVASTPLVASPVAGPGTGAVAAATAFAAAINSHTSSPDYTAVAVTTTVTVTAVVPTSALNGVMPVFTQTGGFLTADATAVAGGVNPASTMVAMAGGADDDAFTPGNFVKTIGSKVYSVSGPILHFSGVAAPTKWTTDNVGAGFIDMSSESSGSEDLVAVARYQNLAAIFAERIVQIWYVDPDPIQNKQAQVLNNTGTASPRSITPFGDTDLFYLDESGLRSLRARDSSNAASTTDIGVPVDDTITAKLQTLTEDERRQVIGLIEPSAGRFWLILKDQIFVFSFFTGAKVSAWSTYDTTYLDDEAATISFTVTEAVAYNRKVYLRSGDTIFCYGGTGDTQTHDDTVAEAWLPYLDAGEPTRKKEFQSLDAAVRGEWTLSAAMDPTDETTEDTVAIVDETTYGAGGRVPFVHQATHVSLRFRSNGTGPHKLGACVIHYEGNDDKD